MGVDPNQSFARKALANAKPFTLARADMFDYIAVFYNRIRQHSHLGGISPEVFEQASLQGSTVSQNRGSPTETATVRSTQDENF